MAKIVSGVFLEEGCYEIVNNMKILQKNYLKNDDKGKFSERVKLIKTVNGKHPNESIVY
jgi:hypothetical protein